MPSSREHLYLSSLFWDGLWIIQQPICQEIQREEPVLFVERFVSVFTVVRYPRLWPRLFTWLLGARRLSPNLRVLSPLPLFHLGHRFPHVFRLEFALQRYWISFWARRRLANRILWFDHPLFECAIGTMGESLRVYHVGDDVAEFRTSHRPTMNRLEERALKRADVVFAAADELARARVGKNPKTFAIQNAIDTSTFQAEVPDLNFADVDKIPQPRVAFIGVVDTWVDIELLEVTARTLPDVSLLIVGPLNTDTGRLKSLANVHFLGVRHRRLVPGILRRCSATLVPFVSNELTARIVPAKVFEGLAAGIIPVCTSFSRNLDSFERQDLVFVARSPEEYVERVRRAVREDSPGRRARIAAFGLQQTWSARWATMSEVISREMERELETEDADRLT
jgi:Glycosyl transferases group 1